MARAWRWTLRLALVLGVAASVRSAITRPAVPLHNPPPETPIETWGTGLAPEVSVRLTVDERGRVGQVELLAVEPASEFDALFRDAAEQTLQRWRYAPALENGVARPTTLEWRLQFPTRTGGKAEEQKLELRWRRPADAESATADLRRKLLSLGLPQRVKYLERIAQDAHDSLRRGKIHKTTTQRFVVYSDGPTAEVVEVTGRNLEAIFNELHKLLGDRLGTHPEPYRVFTFVFASYEDFSRFRARATGIEWAEAFYNPTGLIALHLNMPSNESLLGTLLHETTHAYLDRYIARPGVVLPRWLDEGLAEYLGNSQIKDGKLIPGKIRRSEVYRAPWAAVRGKSSTAFDVEMVKHAVRKRQALRLAELVAADLNEFYGDRREMYYPMSWLLVHFLLHGEQGWATEKFPELVLYIAEGFPPQLAFQRIYGEPAEVEAAFYGYIQRF